MINSSPIKESITKNLSYETLDLLERHLNFVERSGLAAIRLLDPSALPRMTRQGFKILILLIKH